MKKTVCLLLCLTMLLGGIFVRAAEPPKVTLRADKTTVAPGECVTLSLILEGDVEETVNGWQWNLIWDSTWFDLTGVTVGDAAQGTTPVVNTEHPTTVYAAPYQAVTVTQGNTLVSHSLRKGTIVSLTLTAKENLPEGDGTCFYLDDILVIDGNGTPLSVVTSDSRYRWGTDAAIVPDSGTGYPISRSSAPPETQPPVEESTTEETSTTETVESPGGSSWTPAPTTAPENDAPTETTEAVCTVTFESGDDTMTVALGVAPGEKLREPEEPKREGYIFNGWYTAPEGGELWNFDTDCVTEDITLYAAWLAENTAVQQETPENGFPLWTLAAGLPLLLGAAVLYALLGKKRVCFDTCGGTAMEPVYVKRNALLERPMTPVKPGAMFLGWYTAAEGGTPWNFEQRRVRKGMTLYARWR